MLVVNPKFKNCHFKTNTSMKNQNSKTNGYCGKYLATV